jgi:3,4-dihydroxy 2-butanone 4-phosphate synthase / GTP cyclohydrolase II
MTRRLDGALLAVEATPLDTVHGAFHAHAFHNLTSGEPALAVTCGDLGGPEPLLARVHSSCVTSEAYGACDCDCAEQLDAALAQIATEGRGALFYLTQEGRGAGFAAKARDRMLVQASRNRLTTFDAYERMGLRKDQRRYDEVAAMCRLLGVRAPLCLLTNNPDKLAAVGDAGVRIDGHRPLVMAASPWSRQYLDAKLRSGHLLATSDAEAATLPEMVESFEPHVAQTVPAFLRLASYLLPVRGETPAWFRLHLALDRARRSERVVLSHGAVADAEAPLLRVQPLALLERFPVRTPRRRPEWQAALAAIVADGAGCVLVTDEGETPDEATLALLATHLPGRRARPIGALAPEVARGLERLGIALEPPLALAAA